MRNQSHQFKGRGKGLGSSQDNCRIIECTTGSVMAITYACQGVEFVRGYCRRAIIDQWGIFCDQPFGRACDASFVRSWAHPIRKSLFLFSPAKLEIVTEMEWMRQSK